MVVPVVFVFLSVFEEQTWGRAFKRIRLILQLNPPPSGIVRFFVPITGNPMSNIKAGNAALPATRCSTSRHLLAKLLVLGLASLFGALASAQTVPLGSATSFGVLAGSAITSVGPTIITGDLGIHPNNASSVTGFTFSTPPGPGIVNGATHFANAVALQAQTDATTAYNTLAALPCTATIPGDLGGMTLTPGVYCSTSSMGLTGAVTLNGQNDPAARFVFKVGSALTTASGASVNLINGAQSCNIFWQVGSSATLGTGTSFLGTVIAFTSVTINTGTSVSGRTIARNGAVTAGSASISVCSLGGGTNPPPTATPVPALGVGFALLMGLALVVVASRRRRQSA